MQCPHGTEFVVKVVFAGQNSEQVITSGEKVKTKKVSTMSDEQRKAVGIRLQTARAEKMGLTLDQLRTLKIRPGQQPTAEQLAQVRGETKTKTSKPAAKATKK